MESSKSHKGDKPYTALPGGGKWYFLDPDPEHFNIEHAAIALSISPRFNGLHDRGKFVSIAEHTCNCAKAIIEGHKDRPKAQLAAKYAFAHDLHEFALKDWSTPMKLAIQALDKASWDILKDLEHRSAAAIHKALGLEWPVPNWAQALVTAADLGALRYEAEYLFGDHAHDLFAMPDEKYCLPVEVHGWTTDEAYDKFMMAYRYIWGVKNDGK